MVLSCLLTERRGCNRHFSEIMGKSASDQQLARKAAIIGIELRLLQQVVDAPRHYIIVATGDKAITKAVRLGEHIGNSAR